MRKSLSQPWDIIQCQFCYRKKIWRKENAALGGTSSQTDQAEMLARTIFRNLLGFLSSPLPTTLFSLAVSNPTQSCRLCSTHLQTFRTVFSWWANVTWEALEKMRNSQGAKVEFCRQCQPLWEVWLKPKGQDVLHAGSVCLEASMALGRNGTRRSSTSSLMEEQHFPAAPFRSIFSQDLLQWGPPCHHTAQSSHLGFN